MLALALLPALVAIPAFGQTFSQTIRGTVTDAHSSEPLIGATAVIVDSEPLIGSVTDASGRFRLEDVPVGRHSIVVSYVGYESTIVPEILVGSGKEVILDITLSESLVEFEQIVVSAEERKGLPQNEMVSVSATSINVEELSRYAATFDDPARTVLSFPGVRGSGDDVLNEIVVRGNSPRGVLWRIEGIDVPNPNHFAQIGTAGGGISMLSNSMLKTSDFYAGAFPGAYGNALSGVFDIHLREGNNENREFAFEAGLIGIQAAMEGPLSRRSGSSYLVNYRYSALGLLQDIGLEIPGIIRFQDLSLKFRLPAGSAGNFTVWGLGGISAQDEIADPDEGERYNEVLDQTYGVGAVQHTVLLGSGTFLNSSISASYRGHDYTEDSLGVIVEDREDFKNGTLQFASTINRKFSARHTGSLGGVFTRLNFDYQSSFFQNSTRREIPLIEDSGHTNMIQAFGQWQFRATEALTLNTGLHFVRLGFSGSDAIEPRAGFRWSAAPGHVLTGGFGLHSRAETPAIYLAQRETETGDFYQPNLELGLTRARHYVVGYENYQLQNVRFKTEFYYQDLFDVPVLDPEFGDFDWMRAWSLLNATDGYTTLPLVNLGAGRNYGVEATVERYFSGSFYLLATGSYFQSKYDVRNAPESDTRFNGNFIANVMAGKEFRVGSKGNNTISLNARLIWQGNNRQPPIDVETSSEVGFTVFDWSRPFAVRLDDYFRLDVGMRFIKNTASLSHIFAVNIQNVTNRENEMERFYSGFSGEIRSDVQFGILPNVSYRIEF